MRFAAVPATTGAGPRLSFSPEGNFFPVFFVNLVRIRLRPPPAILD
jgi:hypothetical protein